jgi:hypothetical protein
VNRVFLTQAVKAVPHLVLAPDLTVDDVEGFQVQAGRRGHFLSDAEIAFMKRVTVGNDRPLKGRMVNLMNCVGSHFISSCCRSP